MNYVLYGILNIPYHLESQSHCVSYSYNIQNKRENILLRVSLYKVDKHQNVFSHPWKYYIYLIEKYIFNADILKIFKNIASLFYLK